MSSKAVSRGGKAASARSESVAEEANAAPMDSELVERGIVLLESEVARAGFDAAGRVSAAALQVRDEVRGMCAAGRCHRYGSNWACPPACGELDEFRALLASCSSGLVFQTVGKLEDEFDGEAMMEAEALHKQRIESLVDALDAKGMFPERCVVLAAGTCTRCKPCAYPQPCRFPERRLVSMEAAGLLVTDACMAAGVPYNHGPLTIAYTSCVLLRHDPAGAAYQGKCGISRRAS